MLGKNTSDDEQPPRYIGRPYNGHQYRVLSFVEFEQLVEYYLCRAQVDTLLAQAIAYLETRLEMEAITSPRFTHLPNKRMSLMQPRRSAENKRPTQNHTLTPPRSPQRSLMRNGKPRQQYTKWEQTVLPAWLQGDQPLPPVCPRLRSWDIHSPPTRAIHPLRRLEGAIAPEIIGIPRLFTASSAPYPWRELAEVLNGSLGTPYVDGVALTGVVLAVNDWSWSMLQPAVTTLLHGFALLHATMPFVSLDDWDVDSYYAASITDDRLSQSEKILLRSYWQWYAHTAVIVHDWLLSLWIDEQLYYEPFALPLLSFDVPPW